LQFSPIFFEKVGVFLKNQCYYPLFRIGQCFKLKTPIFFWRKYFRNHNIGPWWVASDHCEFVQKIHLHNPHRYTNSELKVWQRRQSFELIYVYVMYVRKCTPSTDTSVSNNFLDGPVIDINTWGRVLFQTWSIVRNVIRKTGNKYGQHAQ
jgi:hypothetical protein